MNILAGDKVLIRRHGSKKAKQYEVVHIDPYRIYVKNRRKSKVYRLSDVSVERLL